MASSARAAAAANGATPKCCAACGSDRSRSCGSRSSRSMPRRSAASWSTWHGLARPRTGLDGLLDVIEQLQGVPIVASLLEREVLPARVRDLHARHARHAARRRRGDVDRRRAARRARRPHRALSDRSRVAAASAGRAGAGAQSGPDRTRHQAGRRGCTSTARRFLRALHEAAGGGFPQGNRRRDLGPRVAGAADQRHDARAAGLHGAAGARAGSPAAPARSDRGA